jgi:hypothetical protein
MDRQLQTDGQVAFMHRDKLYSRVNMLSNRIAARQSLRRVYKAANLDWIYGESFMAAKEHRGGTMK